MKKETKKRGYRKGYYNYLYLLEFSKNSLRKSWSIGTKVAFQYSSLVISHS
jgi:hypothetical protein